MERVCYQCEILTPMFLHGENPNELALRAVAFKSKMRFWWRAVTDLDGKELLKKEVALFGGIDQKANKGNRAPFAIQACFLKDSKGFQSAELLPHKTHRQKRVTAAFTSETTKNGNYLCVELSVFGTGEKARSRLSFYENLFELMAVLDGVGNRSRRGAGSFAIVKKIRNDNTEETVLNQASYDDVLNWLKTRITAVSDAKDTFKVENDKDQLACDMWRKCPDDNWTSGDKNLKFRRTVIWEIPTGDSFNQMNVYACISEASHQARIAAKGNKELVAYQNQYKVSFKNLEAAVNNALGSAKPRMASPVVVSVTCFSGKTYLVTTYLTFPVKLSLSINGLEDQDTDKEKLHRTNMLKRIQKGFEQIIWEEVTKKCENKKGT